ncbi:hypothetical protein O0I10_000129 [Lichtheimia ornata]|uniref:Uncharacterized protein n=1 Tax=Lichtheimia ornata TaxID=688661 RepID=A0AAD8DJ20_9FUNG|nr:uncharacterized protein O0I10_000129 [Lichtheimia ornata]KAJ8663855.1 hypothetical protein O0I10_000129 [Lichtheimia ornata]
MSPSQLPIPCRTISQEGSMTDANTQASLNSTVSVQREQSSQASRLIGEKLLQRWALLNELCTSDCCHAVPLVRDPMHQFMLCVLCETKYMLGHSARQYDFKRGRLQDTIEEIDHHQAAPKRQKRGQ